jgi:Glutaredoxin-like domain (DUF836)
VSAALGWETGRATDVRVRVLGRPGCHLCLDAAAVVAEVCGDDVAWDEVSITSDPELLDRYVDEIPVVLVDGAVLTYWRVTADQLRAALRSAG